MQFNGLLSVAGPTSLDYALPSKVNHFELVNFELLQVAPQPPSPPPALFLARELLKPEKAGTRPSSNGRARRLGAR